MELYRKIDNFENYSVSNLGNVKNNNTNKVLKAIDGFDGYKQINLYQNNVRKTLKIHRLVAFTFPEICGEYKDGLEVDHINTLKDDNRAENLRWVTSKENSNNPLTRKHLSDSIDNTGSKNPMYGKQHSNETKQKIGIKSSLRNKGENNPHFGIKVPEEQKKRQSEKMKGRHRIYRSDGSYYMSKNEGLSI